MVLWGRQPAPLSAFESCFVQGLQWRAEENKRILTTFRGLSADEGGLTGGCVETPWVLIGQASVEKSRYLDESTKRSSQAPVGQQTS